MARRANKFEADAKLLIKRIAGFEEDEENFAISLQYVLSNFTFHKFLAVNSHKITRTLDGIYQKLLVHAQDEKAKSFKKLTSTFLESHTFEDEDKGKTETHYSILSLLLNLSEAPIGNKYTEVIYEKPVEKKDDFDWASYLLEGEDLGHHTFDESPEWSSEEESEDEDGLHKSLTGSGKKRNLHKKVKVHSPAGKTRLEFGDGDQREEEEEKPRTWLENNLVVQYWKGETEANAVTHRSSNLSRDWETYLSNASSIYVPDQKYTLTETQILREVIWMLCGVPQSFVFINTGDRFVVKPEIKVVHLTKGSLTSILSELADYGNIVQTLRMFVDSTSMGKYPKNKMDSGMIESDLSRQSTWNSDKMQNGLEDNQTLDVNENVCQTYQAFSSSMSKYLQNFNKELVALEKKIMSDETVTSLSTILQDLKPRFEELDVLDQIYQKGIAYCCDMDTVTNTHRAAHLLSVLYDLLIECSTHACDQENIVSLVLPIWIQTSKPYLDIIDQWVTLGALVDPQKEFIVQKNEAAKCLDETFWSTAFKLHCPDTDANSQSKPKNAKRTNYTESEYIVEELETTTTPQFLTPVLEPIILAGKSMELLENIGRLRDVIHVDKAEGKERRPLYDIFVGSLQTILKNPEREVADEGVDEVDSSTKRTRAEEMKVFTDNIAHQMRVKGVQDPLLSSNFKEIFQSETFNAEPLTRKEQTVQRTLDSLCLTGMTPVQLILQRCLYPQIVQKYEKVCTTLLDILKNEYQLMDYFAAIRSFYLMAAGDTMYDFYTELFEKLRYHEPWQDVSFLNTALQEALQVHHPHLVDKFFVSIEENKGQKSKSRNRQPITALDGLTLHYKISWPVDVILHSKCFMVYNTVFRFLLQIKRVKYCLDELRFEDVAKEDILLGAKQQPSATSLDSGSSSNTDLLPRPNKIHRMQLFRIRLMHFVNNIHNYIMTRILHTTSLEFQKEIQKATDLDQIINLHNCFVNRLHSQCLLHKKAKYLKEAVTKVLNLSLMFAAMWETGIDNISLKDVNEMEGEFSRWIQFLSSFLNNVIKRGSFPHLESLAFTLISSHEVRK